MRKTLTTILAVALFGILAAVVVAQVREDTAPSGTTATIEDNPARLGTDAPAATEISGPCDEAEHAGDPRCLGADGVVEDRDDDRVEDDRFDDDRFQDDRFDDHREGDNSGPGSVSSGHDALDDDDGPSGHGGSGDDSSGHGGGDGD